MGSGGHLFAVSFSVSDWICHEFVCVGIRRDPGVYRKFGIRNWWVHDQLIVYETLFNKMIGESPTMST